MKRSALIAQLRQQKPAKEFRPARHENRAGDPATAAPEKPAPEAKPRPRRSQIFRLGPVQRWAMIGLCLLLAGGATWAVLHFVVWNRLPPGLAGKWEVQGGPMNGGTFEFFRHGALEVYHAGSDSLLRAQVTVDGKTVHTTTRDQLSGHQETRKSTIRELTETSLSLELDNGTVLKMVRKK